MKLFSKITSIRKVFLNQPTKISFMIKPKKFLTNSKKDNNPQSDQGASGKSSQSGGMSHQSKDNYDSDLMGTMGYMNTQYQEGFGVPIENLILQDHNLIKTVYEKFKNCSSKEEAEKWRNELVYEIARHSIAEEIILYPLMRKKLPDGEKIFQQSVKEHHEVKQNLYQAQSVDPYSQDFKKKVNDVMELLMKHVEKEEKEVIPSLCKHVSEEDRIKSGNAFSRRKLIVPTRPHTMVPESPATLNSILGLLTSPIDKFRDLFTSFPDQNVMSDLKKDAATKASSTTEKTDKKL